MSSEIQQLEHDGLLISPDNIEQIEEVLSKLAGIKAAIRQAEVTIKQRLLDIILETGRDITIGTKRYYAGYPSEYLQLDVKGTIEALLEIGDTGTVADCLRSEPFKPGACSKVLSPDVFKRLFVKVSKAKLEEGRAKKQLMEFDERFVR